MAAPEALNRMDDIDHAADPGQFINYLDRVSAQQSMRTFKAHTFELMGVRAGARVLDAGCGAGDDVRALAQIVGTAGRAVGVDASAQLIGVARARSETLELPGEYYVGSLYQLEFANDSFDAARADRVFMHMAEPQKALGELRRVVRPGGYVLVHDPDWETLSVDAADRGVTRKILNYAVDAMVNGWAGRQLWGLFRQAGFERVTIESRPMVVTDAEEAMETLGLAQHAERACEAGVVTADEATGWMADLRERGRTRRFFAAGMSFIVSGYKVA